MVAGSLSLAVAQVPSRSGIDTIYEQDQKDRHADFLKFTPQQWKQMSERDAQRREQVKTLIAQGALKTGRDYYKAAVVFQHGATPDDILYAHVLAMAALIKGDPAVRSLAAQTLDRFLLAEKHPQVFGTQYNWHEEAGKRVYTMQPYDRQFLSDSLRREFCVASLPDQEKNLDAMKHDRPFPAPDGCR